MTQTCLFGDDDSKDVSAACSAEAHGNVDEDCLERLTEQEFLLFKDGAIADEVADRLRMMGKAVDAFSIRPRVSALKKRGVLLETGTRRPNSKGNNCAVLIHIKFKEI